MNKNPIRIGLLFILIISVIVVIAIQNPSYGQSCNSRYCQFDLGGYIVQNDEWGLNADPSGNQKISPDGDGWRASMNWAFTNRSVKSYPSIVAGWNMGNAWTPNHDGFPVVVSANAPLSTSTSWHTTGTFSHYDVAYDLFLGSRGDQTGPSGELMVWIGGVGNQPAGSQVASGVTLGGMPGTWNVWVGNVGWPVYTFVRTSSVNKFSGNLQPFVYYLAYTHSYLNRSWYILDMQFGAEILEASGTFVDTSFYGQANGKASTHS